MLRDLPGWLSFEAPRRLYATQGKMRLGFLERRRLLMLVAGSPGTFCLQDVCPACDTDDSLCHRLWHCPYPAQMRAPRRPGPPGEWAPTDHVEALRPLATLMAERLWLHLPDLVWPTHSWDVKVIGQYDPTVTVYTDGSCVEPTSAALARAARLLWRRCDQRCAFWLRAGAAAGEYAGEGLRRREC